MRAFRAAPRPAYPRAAPDRQVAPAGYARSRLNPVDTRVAGVVPWGKSILLHGFQKQIVVPRGVAL